MSEEEEYRECVNDHLDDFTRYDQYVDVVSCWEEFLENYKPYFPDYYFDRFPSMVPLEGGDPVTPDFSVYFNDSYGIVFEMSRTFPPDEDLFDKELDQIRSYDKDLRFKTGEGSTAVPDIHDIVLLISTTDSQTIEHRLQEFIDSGRLDLDSNVILMEYTYLDQDRRSKYQFKRLSRVENNFRDEVLPEDWKLSKKLSMEGGTFDSIYSPVDVFYEYKATGVLCNDMPPELYLACYMWQHVFPEYQDDWKNPQSITEISVSPGELRNQLSDYIPDSTINVNWIRESLNFLVMAEVAEIKNSDEYTIKYRNLRDKRREYKDVVTERTQISDLAYLFSNWYCEIKVSMTEGEISERLSVSEQEDDQKDDTENRSGQAGLNDFI